MLALGQLSAGLTHQLNNPAGATARAVADLREGVGKMRHKLAMLAEGKFTPAALKVLVSIQDEVAEQVAKSKSQELTALETSDREDHIGDWLESHGISSAWDYAPTFVEAGLDVDWLERVQASIDDAYFMRRMMLATFASSFDAAHAFTPADTAPPVTTLR